MADEVLDAFVRRLAKIVDRRYDSPTVDDLREDDDFAQIVERLRSRKLGAERVAKFCQGTQFSSGSCV